MLVLWLLLVLIGRWVVYYVSVLVGVWDFWGSVFREMLVVSSCRWCSRIIFQNFRFSRFACWYYGCLLVLIGRWVVYYVIVLVGV